MPVARVAAVLLAVIVVNVLVRVVGTPDIGLPHLPEPPGWLHALLKVKNVALAGLIVAVVVVGLAGDVRKRR
jgi:hypothetical protein